MCAAKVCVDVWSDYGCPLCYVLSHSLRQVERDHVGALRIVWHAFEAAPELQLVERLDERAESPAWSRALYQPSLLHSEPRQLSTAEWRTRLAHEAAVFAQRQGCFSAMHEALFRAAIEEGLDLADEAVLLALGERHGLERERLADALESGRALEQLFADRQTALALKVTTLPTAFIRPAGAPLEQAQRLAGVTAVEPLEAAVQECLAARRGAT